MILLPFYFLVCKAFDFSIKFEQSFSRQNSLGCRFFLFITLNISSHSLLACRVSVAKSAETLMGVPLYVICHFSFVAFNILSLSFYQFDYCVSWCVPPLVYSSWNSLQFLDMVDYFLSCIRKVFSYFLFKYFLRSFLSLSLGPYNVNDGAFNVVPEVS